MSLEVGMYCRYKNFQNKIKIAKIKEMQKADEVFQYDYINFDNNDGELETNIIKASYDIIDILEVGDYVNGYKIGYIDDCKGAMREFYYDYENSNEDVGHWEEEIKSIVTKEQFKNIEYRIGE